MSSLWKSFFVAIVHLIIQEKTSPTLQTSDGEASLARGLKPQPYIKRIPLHRLCEGSMTVEAAVVIPLLLFFFLNLMSAIEMMRLHGKLELALWEKGRIAAVSGYIYANAESGDILGEMFGDTGTEGLLGKTGMTILSDYMLYRAVVSDLGEDYLAASPLTHGAKGLVFLESSYMENDCIDVKVTYQVSPAFCIPAFASFRMANRYYARAWTGYRVEDGEEEKEADYVYVTEYGEVYHVHTGCSYLRKDVREVPLSVAQSIKNNNGEPYSMCEICRGEGRGTVYLTAEGSRYHNRRSCRSLIRNIIKISREAAKARYRPCGRCAESAE